jgi:hypothetical protein
VDNPTFGTRFSVEAESQDTRFSVDNPTFGTRFSVDKFAATVSTHPIQRGQVGLAIWLGEKNRQNRQESTRFSVAMQHHPVQG